MNRKLAYTLWVVALAACVEGEGGDPTAPVAPAGSSLAYITLSNMHPAAGSVIVVTVNVSSGTGAEAVGSFSAKLSLGSGLEFVAESPLTEGMRAVHADGATVNAAGAAPSGFSDGKLFAVQARVTNPAAISELSVAFNEANGIKFGDQMKFLGVKKAKYGEIVR